MPRDIRGRAQRPEGSKAAEPVKAGAAKDPISDPKMAASAKDPDDASMLRDHHDRLARIEDKLGIAHKPSGFKPEDQGGSGKAGAGHVIEKSGATYARKRH